jgi:hypothetical protein
MKLTLKIVVTALILSLLCLTVQAQEIPSLDSKPRYVSDKGFWMVQSNVSNPKESIIYFYNNNKVEVYKEVVSGEKLKLNKRKTLMSLKKILETAVLAWEQNKPIKEDEKLFAAKRN